MYRSIVFSLILLCSSNVVLSQLFGGFIIPTPESQNPAMLTNLNCAGSVTTGSLIEGQPASSVSTSVPYTGGNGGSYSAQIVSSTGVIGLTATLASGTLNSGVGTITFDITGTPSSNGVASFDIYIGEISCAISVFVDPLLPLCFNEYDTIFDIEGNMYRIVQIGSQIWMADNLRTSSFNNGDPVGSIYYNNNPTNAAPYGKLYNHSQVFDPRGICPTGWHVPSNGEWNTLRGFVGQDGNKLKDVGSNYWSVQNNGNNETCFTAVGSGWTNWFNCNFEQLNLQTRFGTSTMLDANTWKLVGLSHNTGFIGDINANINNTCNRFPSSIRCIKD